MMTNPNFPTEPPLTTTLNSYPYVQYSDDENVSAFFTAYNSASLSNLSYVNGLNLPNFLSQTGTLLNYTVQGIYGISRQDLPFGGPRPFGPFNTFELNQEELNEFKFISNSNSYAVSDLVFQRITQWCIYKGDGFQFTPKWLKRRVIRFLSGELYPDNTYQVSVTYPTLQSILIIINSGEYSLDLAPILAAGIEAGVLLLPLEYTVTVEINAI